MLTWKLFLRRETTSTLDPMRIEITISALGRKYRFLQHASRARSCATMGARRSCRVDPRRRVPPLEIVGAASFAAALSVDVASLARTADLSTELAGAASLACPAALEHGE